MTIKFYHFFLALILGSMAPGIVCGQNIREVTVSFEIRRATLKTALKKLEKATGYTIAYPSEKVGKVRSVTVPPGKRTIEQTMLLMLERTDLQFRQAGRNIILFEKLETIPKIEQAEKPQSFLIRGRVMALQEGGPLEGATVLLKNADEGAVTDEAGRFTLRATGIGASIIVSFIGYRSLDTLLSLPIEGELTLNLRRDITQLQELVVSTGYYESSRSMSTGNIAQVSRKVIEKQPVASPVAALQGRIPGVFITNGTGVPGSAVHIQIRGRNTIDSGKTPLVLIDGVPVPYESPNLLAGSHGMESSGGGPNPLNAINPADIERIEILKDADATAIYGSRGANGVVLLTTRKGRSGETRVDLDVYSGFSKVTRRMDVLNTQEYLDLRRKAFALDGITPTDKNAPDLVLWDQNAHTDWQKELIGNPAPVSNVQLNISGGNDATRFMLGSSFRHEKPVLSGNNRDRRGNTHLNVEHESGNKRLNLSLTMTYGVTDLETRGINPHDYLLEAPNQPRFDSTGVTPYWFGSSFNASALRYQQWRMRSDNFIGSALLQYRLSDNLTFVLSGGYTRINDRQVLKNPSTYINPSMSYGFKNFASFANGQRWTYNIEPRIRFRRAVGAGVLSALAGATFQQSVKSSQQISAQDFPMEALMDNLASAAIISDRRSAFSDYRYHSILGHASYAWEDKYVLNGTYRLDGSSRFGEGRRFGGFGAIGAAWIFSREAWVSEALPFVTFGKLRASYGTTGNDQIGDYRYLETYMASKTPYMNKSGLTPNRLPNPDYSWEVSRKAEAGLELAFLNGSLQVNASAFMSRSSNQLVNFPVASQTGFSFYQANLDALIENKGLEFELHVKIAERNKFRWEAGFNLTTFKNTLLRFPGLASSSYASRYEIGESVNVVRGYRFTGVNPENGMAMVEDLNRDGAYNPGNDYQALGNLDPRFFGGFSNTFRYGNFELDIFFDFIRKPLEYGYLDVFPPPIGGRANVKRSWATDYWTEPGQHALRPRPTSSATTAAGRNYFDVYGNSDVAFEDASYMRLRNAALSYNLPARLKKYLKLRDMKVYVHGQNLLTFTRYGGLDPETPRLAPPLKTIVAGIRLTL